MTPTTLTITLTVPDQDDLRLRHLIRVATYLGGSVKVERKEKQ